MWGYNVQKYKKTHSKKWYGTKNDMDLSIFLIISSKCYSSLVSKIHEIFNQMETNFNEQIVPKLI